MTRIGRLVALLAAILFASVPARAQGEISGFGGLASLSPGSPHGGVFGAKAGIWIAQHLQLFGEYSRVPLDPSYYLTYMQGALARIDYTRRYDLVGGGLLIRFLADRKVQPFVVIPHVAAARYTLSKNLTGNSNQTDLAVGAGGGVRLYCGENWGIQPEYRAEGFVNPSDLLGRSFGGHILTAGLFLQFGGK
ncbi:MAG: porin family protein [Acidobacteriia bacterium]|nr:porin family protein [Terriglobia bacterium]